MRALSEERLAHFEKGIVDSKLGRLALLRDSKRQGKCVYGVGRPTRASFFFFQAEDGIRDVAVTGVQTCALPISPPIVTARVSAAGRTKMLAPNERNSRLTLSPTSSATVPTAVATVTPSATAPRSEERRVGKECRSGGWPCRAKRKLLDRRDETST